MSYNDDVFINMVNDNSNKKRILEEVRRKSIVTSETNYIKAKKNKNKKFKLKAISFLLVLGISLPTISFLVNKGFDNRDIYKETHNTASFVSSEMYRVNNNQDYAYDNYDIAKNVLDYNGNKDIHAVIYSCFSVYSYDVLKQMDELFSNMHSLINGHELEYKKEIVDACNYSSFDEYLIAMNFTSIDEYKSKMKDLLLAYSRNDNENEEVKNILAEIENQGELYGGR